MFVCVSAKTRLFAVLLLENRHEIALYRSASQFIFFERCLQSRTTQVFCRVLWPWFLIAARPRVGIEHYGNWVCRPTTSLRERCEHTHEGWRKCQQTMQIGSPSETQELRCGTESPSIPAQSKVTKLRAVHV